MVLGKGRGMQGTKSGRLDSFARHGAARQVVHMYSNWDGSGLEGYINNRLRT